MNLKAAELRGRSCLALDLDGVVYSGETALPGAVEAVRLFRQHGVLVQFATNNSASSAMQIAKKLSSLGIGCSADDIVTSGQLAALRARELTRSSAAVLVVGTSALAEEVEAHGLQTTNDPDTAEAIVVGLDPGFSYSRLAAAGQAARRGVPLIGCNRDAVYPGRHGRLLPGCGPILASVEIAAGRGSDAVVGKPSPQMLTELARRTSTSLERWFVVGDGVESDIAMAQAAGVPSYLVHSPENPDVSLHSLATSLLRRE